MEKLHGRRRRDGKYAVGATYCPGTDVDRGTPGFIHAQLVESGRSRNYIDDAIDGAHLVKMYLFQGRAVDLRFSQGNEFEDRHGVIDHLLGKTALAYDAADIPQAPVVLLATM